jgi:serine protein kinase
MNLQELSESLKNQFKQNKQVQSFEEYLLLTEKDPRTQLRGSAQYAVDMMDHFGRTTSGGFEVFQGCVIGQETVQNQIYNSIKAFAQMGQNHRLILLHGPNGSAKSTITQTLMRGLEDYSRLPSGALYTFSWVFPVDKVVRGSLGIRGETERKSSGTQSFAYLGDEDIACIIPSELRDHPVLLLPVEERAKWFKSLDLRSDFVIPTRLRHQGLSHRDHLIFQALLTNYHGDYAQVLRHIRVERFYFNRVYRAGLVTVEPQMHVDAQYQQLTMNRSLSQIPASLQGLNLFTLTGDLPDANRGMIDYNDLLKRPIDTYKYLLTASESGTVNVGHSIIQLDTLWIGSSNELQLDAFKEYPDFSSFKGRIELIKVPYLLRVSQEREVYQPLLRSIAGTKPVTPHVDWTIAHWAVLTRLKKPHRERYPSELGQILDKLTPLDKARIYDTGELPERFSNDERKILRANLSKLNEEYSTVPFYEGRTGASARELQSILVDASQNPEFKTLSPLAVVAELRNFIKRTSEYEFLRQDAVDGFHHHEGFIETVLTEYTAMVDREVRECLGLYETRQWHDFMKKYIVHLSALLKKEKMKNPITGGYEEPDQSLLNEFENIAQAPSDPAARDQYRMNLITQIGAWVLDHPKEPVDYFKVFPEIKQRIEKHFYESQKSLLQKMNTALKLFGTDHEDSTSEGSKLARQTLENMQKNFGYSIDGAKEVIGFLMSRKY